MTTKSTEAVIGARVRELRHARRMTQQRLSELLGITQGHLSQLERGNASLSVEQLLKLLKFFNVTLDDLAQQKSSTGSQIQNALARQGAKQLFESEDVLPSDRLKNAIAAIREALVSADSSRQIAAVAPVIVNNAGQLNFSRLRSDFAELRLENRLAWALENTLKAIELESNVVQSREWRLKYRRAALIIDSFFRPWLIVPGPTEDPTIPPQYDVLDPEITSREALQEVIENLSPIAKRWKIATRIEVDDFVRALRGARDAD